MSNKDTQFANERINTKSKVPTLYLNKLDNDDDEMEFDKSIRNSLNSSKQSKGLKNEKTQKQVNDFKMGLLSGISKQLTSKTNKEQSEHQDHPIDVNCNQGDDFHNSFSKRVQIDKNSLLFVNDRSHVRHQKKPKGAINDKPVEGEKDLWLVGIDNIYMQTEKDKFINEDQQASLNNDYDYAITQMFRIFLKQDKVYGRRGPKHVNHDNKMHILQFYDSCRSIIYTFNKLKKAIFPNSLSDFKIKKEIEENKVKKENNDNNLQDLFGGVGKLGNMAGGGIVNLAKSTATGVQNISKSTKASGMINMNNQGETGNTSPKDKNERRESKISLNTENAEASRSQIAMIMKNSMASKSMFNMGGTDDPQSPIIKERKQKQRIKQFNKQTIDKQKKARQMEFKHIFFQFAFSENELHEMFKDFHKKFIKKNLIEQSDLISFIEVMAQPDFVGFKKMEEEILPVMGVRKNLMDHLDILNKPTKDSRFAFTPEVHTQVFEALNEGNKFVKFSTMLPYLMIFFLVYLNHQVDKRLKNYSDLLDPNQKTSIFNCFKRSGLRNEDFFKKVITYRKVEEVILDFRSCFPNSFNFDQMDIILRLVRDRMQVDDFSHIEEIKESYFVCTDKQKEEQRYEYIQKGDTILKASSPNRSQSINASQIHKRQPSVQQSFMASQIIPAKLEAEGYSIYDDNEGLSKWLAYNLGLQMMWTQITRQYQQDAEKRGETLDDMINPLIDSYGAYKNNFKFFFEERMWYLAKEIYEKTAFNLVSFNQIVKKTLLQKLIEADHEYQKYSKDGRGIQPYFKANKPNIVAEAEQIDYLNESQNFTDRSQEVIDEQNNQDTQKYVYLMNDYIQVLYDVTNKNICPFAKFHNIEMAVYYYIQNLCHKCESILMDYLQFFQINKKLELSKTDNLNAKKKDSRDMTQNELREQADKRRINDRLKRIYGSTHESVHQEQVKSKLLNVDPMNLGGNLVNMVGDAGGIVKKKTTQEWLEIRKCASLNKKERLLELGIDNLDSDLSGAMAAQMMAGFGGLTSLASKGVSSIGDGMKAAGDLAGNLTNTNTGLQNKQKLVNLKEAAKSQRLNLKKVINEQIDQIFITEIKQVPSQIIESQQIKHKVQPYSVIDENLFFSQGITNYLSKQNNKYCFKLMQIFGFRNENLLSLIDKDEMKMSYLKLKKKDDDYVEGQNDDEEDLNLFDKFLENTNVNYQLQYMDK